MKIIITIFINIALVFSFYFFSDIKYAIFIPEKNNEIDIKKEVAIKEDSKNNYISIKMANLYHKDLSFSDLAKSLEGKYISVTGFMAPPLEAESNFFVLTKRPLAVCPFCETDSEWPDDILAIYTKEIFKVVSFNRKIEVIGKLELGSF